MTVNPRRVSWDERHRAGDFEGHGPNPTLMAALSGLPGPGEAAEDQPGVRQHVELLTPRPLSETEGCGREKLQIDQRLCCAALPGHLGE